MLLSIEADAISEEFLWSIEIHGLKYNKLIGTKIKKITQFFEHAFDFMLLIYK